MDFPKCIEGDYIETRDDNLFFDVKGLLHPNDRKICFLRFYPDSAGDRIKNDLKYKKIYDLEERYKFLKKKFPNYLFISKEIDLELQGVKLEEIKQIYTPRDYFKRLIKYGILTPLERNSLELCQLIINECGIKKESVGISGSCMIGLNKPDSDIDIIIYGTNTSLKLQNKLELLFKKSSQCRKYTIKEYKNHYNWRFGGSNIDFEDFLRSEKRKLHQGKFNGIDFFIRYIKSPNDWKGDFYDYKYKNYGRVRIKAKILDDSDSIFTPCSYKIEDIKILDQDIKKKKINSRDIKEVCSFRGRFCEQAKKGEKVLVEGKLEGVQFKNDEVFYRVLLTNQVQDKMIILNN